MKTEEYHNFLSLLLYKLSHATKLAVIMAFILILLPYSAAQNETLPSLAPPSKSDDLPFDPKVRISPSIAIILVCLVSAFFIMGCVSVSIRHCSHSRHDPAVLAEDRAPGSRRRSRQAVARGLESWIIDKFPIFQYSDVKGLKLGKGALECAVCLNEFEDDETLRLIPKCSHVFHPDCIDAWLASHVTCPVCRANLDLKPGDQDDCDPETENPDSVSELPISVPTQELSNSAHEPHNLGIHIHIGSPELTNHCQTTDGNYLPKTPGVVNGKFLRSHSTGHSLVQPGQNCERFTLILPMDVRARLINSELNRTKSCTVAFNRARSSTKGFWRSGSGGGGTTTRAHSTNSTPAFFSRSSSTKEALSGEKSTVNPKSLLRSVKSFRTPFERLFNGAEKEFDGERSFSKLRLDGNPV